MRAKFLLAISFVALASTACTGVSANGSDSSADSSADTSSTDTLSGDGGSSDEESSSDEEGSGTDGGMALPVELGSARDFVILAKSGISTVPTSGVTGDIGVSPAAATFMTGFSLTMDATNEFSTSSQITGRAYAADYSPPTPTKMTSAIGDMELAFVEATDHAPDVTELGAGDIGGMTVEAGVYKWSTNLLIPTDVTLAGSDTDVWVFQIDGDLTVANATKVVLSGGARSENVFWQVAGLVDFGTTSHFEGVVLCATSITLRTGASVNGRLLAQTSVDMDANAVLEPAI